MSREEATYVAAGLLVISAILSTGEVSAEKQIEVSKLIKDAATLIGKSNDVDGYDLQRALGKAMGESL